MLTCLFNKNAQKSACSHFRKIKRFSETWYVCASKWVINKQIQLNGGTMNKNDLPTLPIYPIWSKYHFSVAAGEQHDAMGALFVKTIYVCLNDYLSKTHLSRVSKYKNPWDLFA